MSIVTISAIKADIGGYVGHSAVHPDLHEEAKRRVGEAIARGLLIDAKVSSCGDDLNLVMTHRHGVDAEPVHHFVYTRPCRRSPSGCASAGSRSRNRPRQPRRGEHVAVSVGDRSASPRPKEHARGRRAERAATAPHVLVMPGCERFVSELGIRSVTHTAVQRFANGELHVRVPERVDGRPCLLVGSISPPAGNLERLTLVAHALCRGGAERITALLPYLAYARQDRAARTESLGLQWAGELLHASGIGEIVSVDVHSAQATEVLGLPLTSLSPAELLAGALPAAWLEEVSFVAPDEGAIDRASAVAHAAAVDGPVVWARKRRTMSGIEHLGLVGTPGRRAIVVDDILDTGDTLVSCYRTLRDAGVTDIAIIATHGLFTGDRWRVLLAEDVQTVLITDTVLSCHRPAQVQVAPVAPLLAVVLKGRHD